MKNKTTRQSCCSFTMRSMGRTTMMPMRFLIYLAEEYQKIVGKAESSIYGSKLISLPTPQCVVFYNGKKEMPDKTEDRNAALNMAIDYCIGHGILSEVLRKERAEVLGMLLEEFDAEKYERTIRAEEREEAIKSSIMKFIDAMNELGIPAGEIKHQLVKRFKLSDAEAEERLACL